MPLLLKKSNSQVKKGHKKNIFQWWEGFSQELSHQTLNSGFRTKTGSDSKPAVTSVLLTRMNKRLFWEEEKEKKAYVYLRVEEEEKKTGSISWWSVCKKQEKEELVMSCVSIHPLIHPHIHTHIQGTGGDGKRAKSYHLEPSQWA